MKLELIIFGITGLLSANAYYDGKYSKIFIKWKKYIQIATILFLGLSVYLLFKKNPIQSKNFLLYANNAIKYMPIDKYSKDIISPIFDLTNKSQSFMEGFNQDLNPESIYTPSTPTQSYGNGIQRMMNSGHKATKRSVSETKKKFVASNQNWLCGECKTQLNAWFEVDHKTRLEYGGGNDVNNLVALCRECHGKKTAMENM
jgi:hypothetical protein